MSGFAKKQTVLLVMCAVFAALSVVLSPVKIPIGTVPVGIVHVSIFTAAGLLGARKAALSQAVFVLVGLAGLPIFAASGLGGPTGGFIVSYTAAAFVTGALISKFGRGWVSLILAMYAGWIITYAIGVPWFIAVTGSELRASLGICVLPFLPGDFVKTILSAVLIRRLSKIFSNIYH